MAQCFRHVEGKCRGRVEWEHCWLYANKQINERWAIIPACGLWHHRGPGLDKNANRAESLRRMTPDELAEAKRKYPRTDWEQLRKYHLCQPTPDQPKRPEC